VWKRLNRINKRASKFRFTASYQDMYLEAGGRDWQPTALSVVWTRRGRRLVTDPVKWEPTMKSPYIGMCVWPVPDNQTITVTLFRDQRTEEYESKDWFFIIEDVTSSGKRRPVAQARLNLQEFASSLPSQQTMEVKLRPLTKKVKNAKLTLTLSGQFLREGKATDDDMRSEASIISNSTLPPDIAILDDLEEEEENATALQISDVTKQINNLSESLCGGDDLVETEEEKRIARSQPVLQQAQIFQTSTPYRKPDFGTPNYKSEVRTGYGRTEINSRSYKSESNTTNEEISFPKPELYSRHNKPELNSSFTKPETNKSYVQPEQNELFAKPTMETKMEHRPISIKGSNSPQSAQIECKVIKPTAIQTKSVDMIQDLPKEENPPSSSLENSLLKEESSHVPLTPTSNLKSQSEKQEDIKSLIIETQSELVETQSIIKKTRHVRNVSTDITNLVSNLEVSDVLKGTNSDLINLEKQSPVGLSNPAQNPIDNDENNPNYVQEKIETENKKNRRGKLEPTVSQDNFMRDFLNSSTRDTSFRPIPASNKKCEISSVEPSLQPVHNGNTTPNAPKELEQKNNIQNGSSNIVEKVENPFKIKTERDIRQKSASSDLLEWSKSICSKYSLKITNFTTSWRNGLAFCALIHNFYPELIPYETLVTHDIKYNCKLAFEAGEKMGIPRIIEPEDMVIKMTPDKLSVITYLHQLKSTLGTEQTKLLLEHKPQEKSSPAPSVRKSFSESNIRHLSRGSSRESDSILSTVEEEPSQATSLYRQRAKDLISGARAESSPEKSVSDPSTSSDTTSKDEENIQEEEVTPSPSGSGPPVTMRGRSSTPKKKDNRLSYIDNEMRYLDMEQGEIDKQAAILDKRLRETSDTDQLVYDNLLQQWFNLVNQKNALLRRQMQLNILEKEKDLEKKYMLLQDELRTYQDMDDGRKTEEDRNREELLLEELMLVVDQRNQLVIQRDQEEQMIDTDNQIVEEVTVPDDTLMVNKSEQNWLTGIQSKFFSKK